MAPFTHLATELLWIIVESFSQRDLHSCTLVNKQLYIATNYLLWRFRQLADGDTTETILAKATIDYHPIGHWIRKLEIHFSEYWTDARLFDLIDNKLGQLEELHLDRTLHLTEQSLIHLARRNPTLRQVYLNEMFEITERFMDALGYYCLQLNKLVLTVCPRLGGDSYAALQNCPIQVMHIIHPPLILQTEKAMWDLIVHYPTLTELKLVVTDRAGARFMKSLLSAAVGAWPYLNTLALEYYVSEKADDPLAAFLTYHQGIERMSLQQCSLGDYTWNHIIDLGLPCLEELNIKDKILSPIDVRKLVFACPQLSFLTFRSCCNWPLALAKALGKMLYRYRHHCEPKTFVRRLYSEDISSIRNSDVLPDTARPTSTQTTTNTPTRTPRATSPSAAATTSHTATDTPRQSTSTTRSRAAMTSTSRTSRNTTPSTEASLSRTTTTTSSHTATDTPRQSTSTTRSRAAMTSTSRTSRNTTPSTEASLSRTTTTTSSHTTTDTPRRLTSSIRSRATMAAGSRTSTNTTPSTTATLSRTTADASRRSTATTRSRAAMTTTSRTLRITSRSSTDTSPRSMTTTSPRDIASSRAAMPTTRTTTAASTRRTVGATPSRSPTSTAPRLTTTTRRTTTTLSNTVPSTRSRTTATSASRAISMGPRPQHPSPRSAAITSRATTNISRATSANSSQVQPQQTPLGRRRVTSSPTITTAR